jgi:glycosyltransferase involved in cell wall biosynthesis
MQNPLSAESISVFFPAYNDAGTIGTMVTDALALLPQLTNDFEIIVINDGSTDDTAQILDQLARQHSQLRIIQHPHNLGYGAALRSGFSHAQKDLIFYTDGDAQYDIHELPELLALMTDEVEVVNGWKRKRSDNLRRVVLGEIYKRTARMLFRLPIRDVDCDFRLIRRSAISRFHLEASSGIICTEMVRKLHAAGCRFVETPVHHYPRQHGESQFFTWRRVGRTAVDFGVLWLKLFITQPLKRRALSRSLRKFTEDGTRAGIISLSVHLLSHGSSNLKELL